MKPSRALLALFAALLLLAIGLGRDRKSVV